MPWGWLHSQSLRRAELHWPEDDHGFARGWGIPSDGLVSCSVCTCCIALGLLHSMQHPQILLGRAVLTRHISCTLSQAASPSFGPVCCRRDWDKFGQGPDPVNELRPSLENDVLQPLLALDVSLQVEDASMSSQPSLPLRGYHQQ